MDTILEQAREKAQALRTKAAKLTEEAGELESDIRAIEAADLSRKRLLAKFPPDSESRTQTQTEIILDGVEAILTRAGHRLRLADLVAQLAEQDIQVVGDPRRTPSPRSSLPTRRGSPLAGRWDGG